jgi:hypothetical protein
MTWLSRTAASLTVNKAAQRAFQLKQAVVIEPTQATVRASGILAQWRYTFGCPGLFDIQQQHFQ